MRRLLLLSIPLVATLTGAGSYWIGGQLEAFVVQHRVTTLPEARVRVMDFRRGWFGSEADTRVRWPATPLPPLELHQRFRHGSLNPPALLTVTSEIAPDSVWCRRLLDSCAPENTHLDSHLYWDGSSRHRLALAGLRLPGILELHDLDTTLRLTPEFDRLQGSLDMNVERLTLTGRALDLQHADFEAALTAGDRRLSGRLALQIAGIRHQGHDLGRLTAELSVERLDARILATLLGSSSAYIADTLLRWQGLLQQRPHLTLKNLDWRSPRGTLQLQGELTLRAVGVLQLLQDGPLALVAQGRGRLSVTRALAEEVLTRQLGDAAAARERLTVWRRAGFVSLDNNVYHCRFVIEDEGLFLNGNPVGVDVW